MATKNPYSTSFVYGLWLAGMEENSKINGSLHYQRNSFSLETVSWFTLCLLGVSLTHGSINNIIRPAPSCVERYVISIYVLVKTCFAFLLFARACVSCPKALMC